MGNSHSTGAADITVASVQSIASGDRLEKFKPERFKLILVDEAHHIVARQYLEVLDHFGLKAKSQERSSTCPALVGVSATFSRFDGKSLGAAIDQIVYHKDYVDMIGEKWLCDVVFTTVESKADISRVRTSKFGDFQTGQLSEAVNNDETNEITFQAWKARAEGRKSTLVFCVDLNHVTSLCATFRRHGIDAKFITGDTPARVRSARLDEFRAGAFPVLLNCGVFTEGTDIPNIDCVLLARPTKSRNLLVQMIGRGMRLHSDKKNCHIIDMVASLNAGIISVPTLFGLDPEALVDEATPEDMDRIRERKEKEKERERKVAESSPSSAPSVRSVSHHPMTFTDYDSVGDLIEDTSEEQYIRRLSLFTWVCVDTNKFVLAAKSGSYLTLDLRTYEKTDNPEKQPKWIVTYTARIPVEAGARTPFMKPRIVGHSSEFPHAVRAADTFATEKLERFWIDRNQPWRQAPATQSQLAFLNKLRDKESQLTAINLTKGQAGDMITKLKHGAKGRWDKIAAAKKKGDKRLNHLARMKAKENVSVGPLLKEELPDDLVVISKGVNGSVQEEPPADHSVIAGDVSKLQVFEKSANDQSVSSQQVRMERVARRRPLPSEGITLKEALNPRAVGTT